MDLRLKSVPYELDGKTYQLRCNMAVLMDVQEAFDGDLTQALSRAHSMRGLLEFLAAMLNDAAETQDLRGEDGKLLRVTARELGRKLTMTQTTEAAQIITKLIMAAMPEQEDAEKPKRDSGGNQPKN